MPRTVEFEIPKSRREVAVFKADAVTVEAMPVGQRKGNEVSEDVVTIVRIKPQDIPELIRWARSHYNEWKKRQPAGNGTRETTRVIDDEDLGEDGDDDAL